jgi:hypothetical protein
LGNEEIYNLYALLNNVRVEISKRKWRMGNEAHMGKLIIAYNILVEPPPPSKKNVTAWETWAEIEGKYWGGS